MSTERVIVYEHAQFQGRSQRLLPGEYDREHLAIGDDAISSLRVPIGWTVTLFEHAGLQGAFEQVTSDLAYVGNDFNDRASSLRSRSARRR